MIQLLLAFLAKAALVLALPPLFARLARRFGATAVHRLWVLGAAAALLLLPLSFSLASVPVGVRMSEPAGIATNMIVLLWLAVAGVLTLKILLDHRALRRLTNEATEACDRALCVLARDVAVSMRVRRRVHLREWHSPMPAASGWLRPTIFLPVAWRAWPAKRLELVLAHEMSHIARHDTTSLLIARVAAALHWFNPLAWLTLRRIRIECERACDERVLEAGADASAYAGALLDTMADCATAQAPAAAAAVAMISSKDLESRLLGILSDRRSGRDRKLPAAILAALIAVAAFLLASLSLEGRPYASGGYRAATIHLI